VRPFEQQGIDIFVYSDYYIQDIQSRRRICQNF
jgi:hypothetical protein